MIEVINLTKKFFISNEALTVLDSINFKIPSNSWASLTGPSGSGKTTLLGLLAGLDNLSSGSVKVLNEDLSTLDEEARAQFRAENMGFIFQSFRLVPTLSALENVQVPLEILNRRDNAKLAKSMLERVGLSHRLHHFPNQLSGGEQQRIAIARAFVSQPKILFADEPTGNLDSRNGALVLNLLRELKEEHKSTLVVVTHDAQVAAHAELQLRLKDGRLVE